LGRPPRARDRPVADPAADPAARRRDLRDPVGASGLSGRPAALSVVPLLARPRPRRAAASGLARDLESPLRRRRDRPRVPEGVPPRLSLGAGLDRGGPAGDRALRRLSRSGQSSLPRPAL